MSGLAKALSSDFISGLGDELTDTSKDLSGFYKSFLEGTVIPNAQFFGYLVMIGELAIGVFGPIPSIARGPARPGPFPGRVAWRPR